MGPREIADVCSNLSQLSLGAPTPLSKGNLKKCNLTYDGQGLAVRLEGEVAVSYTHLTLPTIYSV